MDGFLEILVFKSHQINVVFCGVAWQEELGMSPAMRMTAQALGLTPSQVHTAHL